MFKFGGIHKVIENEVNLKVSLLWRKQKWRLIIVAT